MGEAHRAFTSMDRVLQRTTTNSDNKVSKLIDQLKARTDEFTAATNKTMNAINPTETLVARMRAYGTAVSVGVFIGAAVTAGVLAGLASLAAMRAPQLKEARDEAKRLFQKFTVSGPSPPPDGNDLEERVGDMERKLGETRATLQERVTAVRVLRGSQPPRHRADAAMATVGRRSKKQQNYMSSASRMNSGGASGKGAPDA